MCNLTKKIIGEKPITEKRNFLWNMAGSGIFSLISMALPLCVIQIVGDQEGGIFSIAVTISQMMLYIAYFELRTFLVTDTGKKYSFSQYHGAKIITCVLMMVVSTLYIGVKGYTPYKALVILLMCVYRMIDGYADIFEGEFQLDGRLYLAGKSMMFRSVISAVLLVAGLALTGSLIIAILLAIAASGICLVVFNINIQKYYSEIRPSFHRKRVGRILYECTPFFVGAFLWVYILSASRIAVDNYMSSENMAYYQVLFMPVSIINLFATFFFRPALTSLSEMFYKCDKKGFLKKVRNLLLLIVGFTLVCMLGAYLLGIPVLSLVSGCDLSPFRKELVILMVAGGANSASFFMYYLLTIMRKSKSILFGYGSSAVLTYILSNQLVRISGIGGAIYSFLITVVYMFCCFLVVFGQGVKRMDKKPEE